MKKILRMMGVLLALGMLFVGCAQPKDETNNDNWKKAVAADFEGDLSWIIGTWKVSYEFEGYTEAQIERIKSNYTDMTASTEQEAEGMAERMKNMIEIYEDSPGEVSINSNKTKIRIGGQNGSIKCFIIYTKQ